MKTNVKPASIRNHEGVVVQRVGAEAQLRRAVMACMLWEDSFYEDGQSIVERIAALVSEVAADKVADIAIEARSVQNLRHVPLLIAREMARHTTHRPFVAKTLAEVIQRPDELSEFVALYWKDGKAPLASQVKKGLARAFTKFNEYSLAKYNGDGAVKLRDVLFLCHAKPKDAEQVAVWKKLVDGKLATPDTWEVALSGGANKRESFERLMGEGKLGGLAFIRNLRNMQEAGVPLTTVTAYADKVDLDRVLPFRFITAAKYVPQWEPMIEKMMLRCLDGSPKLTGRTALIIDTSPSMWQANVTAKSEMTRFDAAAALAILAREVCEEVNVYYFNNTAAPVPARRGFALRDALVATQGNASRGGLAVELANRDGYDRIIVLTDGQWHPMRGDLNYRTELQDGRKVSPPPLTKKAYMLNVSVETNGVGYGPWTSIDGFSEAVVSYIQASEKLPLA